MITAVGEPNKLSQRESGEGGWPDERPGQFKVSKEESGVMN